MWSNFLRLCFQLLGFECIHEASMLCSDLGFGQRDLADQCDKAATEQMTGCQICSSMYTKRERGPDRTIMASDMWQHLVRRKMHANINQANGEQSWPINTENISSLRLKILARKGRL